jgi:hypothetical protein
MKVVLYVRMHFPRGQQRRGLHPPIVAVLYARQAVRLRQVVSYLVKNRNAWRAKIPPVQRLVGVPVFVYVEKLGIRYAQVEVELFRRDAPEGITNAFILAHPAAWHEPAILRRAVISQTEQHFTTRVSYEYVN